MPNLHRSANTFDRTISTAQHTKSSGNINGSTDQSIRDGLETNNASSGNAALNVPRNHSVRSGYIDNVDQCGKESTRKVEVIQYRDIHHKSDSDVKGSYKSTIEDKIAKTGKKQEESMEVVIQNDSNAAQIGNFAPVNGTESQLNRKDQNIPEEDEIIESKFFIDRSPPRLKRTSEEVDAPSPDESVQRSHSDSPGGFFYEPDGPQIIMNEDSMQSIDYEKSMLDQNFNCDTVDVLGTLEEDDDEDVL
jgi:hypothetical protein